MRNLYRIKTLSGLILADLYTEQRFHDKRWDVHSTSEGPGVKRLRLVDIATEELALFHALLFCDKPPSDPAAVYTRNDQGDPTFVEERITWHNTITARDVAEHEKSG